MKRKIAIVVLLISSLLIPVKASANTWNMQVDPVTLGMTGVSPHVERINGVDRVWRSDGPGGTRASDCNDAGVCTNVSLSGTFGNDFTVVNFANGTKRGYFKFADPASQQIFSAPCNDAGCTSVGSRTATSDLMKVSREQRAWGVPDPVLLPDGRVRIYMVEMPQPMKCGEKIASYISSDGINFTKEPGWRLEGGYVDTEVLRAKDGDWIMILADIACTSSNRQELYVTTSKDGLEWEKPTMLVGSSVYGLDPTGYEVSPNVFRIYFSQESRMGAQDFSLKRATLTLTPTPAVVATPTPSPTPTPSVTPTPTASATPSPAVTPSVTSEPKQKTITCVKGKKKQKVTAVKPKCPKGFKKAK